MIESGIRGKISELLLICTKTSNSVFLKLEKKLLEFVFLQNHRCLPIFWCHIVLYIQRTFTITSEIPSKITQKV